GEKELWRALKGYATCDLEKGQREALWRAVALGEGKPVKLPPRALRVGVGLPHFQPFSVTYRLWLVPASGAVFLFGYPEGDEKIDWNPVKVYEETQKRLAPEKSGGTTERDPPEVLKKREAAAREVEALGPHRFALLFLSVLPDRGVGRGVPRIERS